MLLKNQKLVFKNQKLPYIREKKNEEEESRDF